MNSQEHIFMINSSVERTRGNRAINTAVDENYGEILKSGDNTLLRYKIFDGDGEILPLEGLPCEAVIKKGDKVVYRTPAEIDAENIVSFKITEVLPSDRNNPYTIEFIITQDQDTLIFPSDDRINLYIYPSSLSVDSDIIEQTPEAKLNEIVIVAVNDATQEIYDSYNELIDTGVIQENINQKLVASEAEYAPRLTSLEQNDAELTAQLAQIPRADEVFLKQNGININDLDEPTRQTFLEAQGIDVNYVLGEENVKPLNTTFFKRGSNLFNKLTKVDNHYVSESNGELMSTTGYHSSDYILIQPSADYYVNRVSHYAFYDANKNFISGFSVGNQTNGYTFKPPINAKYIRFSYIGDYANTVMLNTGTSSKPYEEYVEVLDYKMTVENFDENTQKTIGNKPDLKLVYGKNLFNKSSVKLNQLLNNKGLTTLSTGWDTSDFIEVPSNTQISISNMRYLCEYDVTGNFINGAFKDGTSNQNPITFTTGKNTKYIRVTFSHSLLNSLQVEIGAEVTGYNPYTNPVLKKTDGASISVDYVESMNLDYKVDFGGKNRFDPDFSVADKTLSPDGSLGDSLGWITSDFIPVEPSRQVAINRARFVMEYDKYKVFVGGTRQDMSPESQSTFNTSPNTAYIRITTHNTNLYNLQIEYGDKSTSFEKAYYSIYYAGKKVYDLKEGGTMQTLDLLSVPDYYKVIDRSKYQIWKRTGNKKLMALHKNIAVTYDRTIAEFAISTNGVNGDYDNKVIFTDVNFPNLIPGSLPEYVLVIPHTRNLTTSQHANDWRMVVISQFGQIYHNFPSRATETDGQSLEGDMLKFDESVIWDLPERKFPSKDKAATNTETYFPGLPDSRYEYRPAINDDNGYGHGGFGKSIEKNGKTYPRFYLPDNNTSQNSFSPMGGFEPDDKITLLGTYRSNAGEGEACRICVFATDDGGRSWYNKYEFTSDDTVQNFTTHIDTSGFATAYPQNLLAISKRTLVLPTETEKEPVDKFTWGTNVVVSNMTRANKCVVTTSTPHGLSSGNVIAFKSNSGSNSDWDWMANDTVSSTSGGNGKLFRVKVLTDKTFEVYEFVHSAQNNLPCRHIHGINRVKDGWIISTGERYPNGWIMYMQMKAADTFYVYRAYQDFPIIRLNSSDEAAQRLIGGTMLDDPDSTMIVAMDDETAPRDPVTMPEGRTETFTRSSTGVFKGKLADIDDLDKFVPIYEATEVSYFFKEKAGTYIWIGQRGEFALSLDKGETWLTENLGEVGQHFYGESNKVVVVDNFIIFIK